ncbi:MAG: hypothetical protein ABII26_06745 [Pseudomonadota bacterium]
MKNMEKEIIKLIEQRGPLIGAEILEATEGESLLLWRTCKLSKNLTIKTVGCRYLRLDRRIEGYARLSPSFLREFLTYSIIGLSRDSSPVTWRTQEISTHIEKVSKAKSELAYSMVSALTDRLGQDLPLGNQVCFILAGDIVYNMAHDIPRPERSTGKMVNGSDVDMVVIVHDRFPIKLRERLDEEIYREKQRLLTIPHIREEIDYVVKNLDRVREQLRFDTFKHMIACKILQEGTLLYGSEEIFHSVKTMLVEHGVIDRLNELERNARAFRKKAEEVLLLEDLKKIKEESLYLFYPSEEAEEFE